MQKSRELSLRSEQGLYIIHGSPRGYAIFGCDCEECTAEKNNRAWSDRVAHTRNRTATRNYVLDLLNTGSSDSPSEYNRKCVRCNKQCIPTHSGRKVSEFPIPVARISIDGAKCVACEKRTTDMARKVIDIGQPCIYCGKPMRPSKSKPIEGYPTVQHTSKGVCNSCNRRLRNDRLSIN